MRLCGVEALLRWRSPRFGEVAPAVFVPILEETGLIVPVGEWMLRQAAAQTRAWAGQGLRVRRLAVNLTLSQLRAAATVRALEQVLVDSDGLAGCQLEVEVTESTLMSDAEGMGELLRTLTGLGVRIAVDDFGRGTCALGWLESFPISGIKVDPLFLGELDANPDHAQLARAMFDLGRALNLRVSAEGVETASQLAFIRSNGCEEAQGFYLARPLEAEHFLAGASQTFH
jgi:EAL domain-containing protein (putative c-di-GMP-specific phosphodiesterase class I)